MELGAIGSPRQGFQSSKWEYQKNSTILELEARNRALQDRLAEAAQAPKPPVLEGAAGQNIKDRVNLEELLASIRGPSQLMEQTVQLKPRGGSGIKIPGSQWEWHKNSALLELERRNQALRRQLDAAELASLEQKALAERERQLFQELLQREAQNDAVLRKASAVKQRLLDRAQAAVDAQVMLNALGGWREATRAARKKKLLGRLLVIWRKEELRKGLRAFREGLEVLRAKAEKMAAAETFRRVTLERRAAFSWGVLIGRSRWRKEVMERVRESRLRLTGTFVFAGWRETCWDRQRKRLAAQRAVAWRRRTLLRTGWVAWRAEQDASAQKAVEAEALYCKHILERWNRVTALSRLLKSRTGEFGIWRAKHCLKAWGQAAQSERQRKQQVKSMQTAWQARVQGCAFQGWFELVERKRFLRTCSQEIQKKMATRIQRWGWDVVVKLRRVKLYRERTLLRRKQSLLRAWSSWCSGKLRHRALVSRELQRGRRSALRRAIVAWKSVTDEGVRLQLEDSSARFSERIHDLEAKLSAAKTAQSEALSWLEEYQAERRTLLASAELANARTPVWSSGMLDAELRWRAVGSAGGLSPRSGHSAAALFEDPDEVGAAPRGVVVFGGWNGTEWFNDAYLFDSESQVWTEVVSELSEAPLARNDHCACAIPGRRMLVFGGFDGSDELADLHVLTVDEDGSTFHWSQPDLGIGARPGPLSHASCCLLPSGRHVALFGGYRSGSGLLNELWVLELDRWEWSQPEVAGDPPRARRGHVMEVLGDLVVVHGGYDGQAHLSDLYVLDLNTMVWRRVDPVGDVPAPRRGHVSTAIGRHVLIHGGFDGADYLDDVYTLDIDGFIWLQRAPMTSAADHVELVGELGAPHRELREIDPNVGARAGTMKGVGRVRASEVEGGIADENDRRPGNADRSEAAKQTKRISSTTGRDPEKYETGKGAATLQFNGAPKREPFPEGRAFHQAVFDGHRVVVIGGAHSHSVLESVLLLENTAAEDGRALARVHFSALEEANDLRNECMRLERELAAARAEGSGFRAAGERLAAALRVEAQAKKGAIAAQRILGQKLKKARAEGAELDAEVSSLQEQLQSKAAECHLAHQHVTSAQKALHASEADHQKALFQAAAAAQEERLRAAGKIAELEALVGFHETEFRRKAEEAEALRADRNGGAVRVAELEGEVQRVRGLLAKADEEAELKVRRATEEGLAAARALERRLQEQEAEAERVAQTAREEATGQAEARAQSSLQIEQLRAERLGERVRTLEKERVDERRFVESYRRERDAAEAARREAEAMRAEALEYTRAMESRCREELARMEEKVRAAGLARWQADAEVGTEDKERGGEARHQVEVLLEASLGG